MGRQSAFKVAMTHGVLLVFAAFSLVPIVVTILTAFKSQDEATRSIFTLPSQWRWENFAQAFSVGALGTGFINSAVLVVGSVICVVIVASLAAYALARLPLPGGSKFILYLLVGNSLPLQMFLVPLFFTWTRLGLYDTHVGLILIYAAVNAPFATLLLRSFMVGIPRDYEDAARIDGATELRVALSVTFPLVRSGIITIALTTGLAVYNEFLLALLFLPSPEFMPLAPGLFNFRTGFTENLPLQAAASLTMIAPMAFAFLLFQKKFVSGMTATGLGGT